MYEVEGIIDKLMMAAKMVKNCKQKLLDMGFSEKESDELLQVYVYKTLEEE